MGSGSCGVAGTLVKTVGAIHSGLLSALCCAAGNERCSSWHWRPDEAGGPVMALSAELGIQAHDGQGSVFWEGIAGPGPGPIAPALLAAHR